MLFLRVRSVSISEFPTPLAAVTGYNNYYEFGTSKVQPPSNATHVAASPWTVTVEGAVRSLR